MRRALLIFLVLVNAATPTLASICATDCAGGDIGRMSVPAHDMSGDCHGQSAPATSEPASSESDEESSLMQAVCAMAGTAAVVSAAAHIERTPGTERIDPPAHQQPSWVSFPPEHPPRPSTT